jgi:hypothetical protein
LLLFSVAIAFSWPAALSAPPAPPSSTATPPATGRAARKPPSAKLTAADFDRHVAALKERVPAGFTILVQSPFVVIGDSSPEAVQQSAEHTVKWAVDKLKAAYFDRDPAEILDIWLFKDKASYEKYTQQLFHTQPDTPFGFFSHADRALVMNIATGGGTLVHEIVHAFMAANFPDAPAWFNEGLASLYEQCGDEDGKIHGYTNWRLAGLQEAIRKRRLPSFQSLCTSTDKDFYEADKGANYAQARYLCYYLQEHGLLGKFYRRFRVAQPGDRGGYRTLQEVLGRTDMATFQRQWEAWVLKLTFP